MNARCPSSSPFFAAACLVLACTAARAEVYPSRPITLVVAYSPGGATDAVARAFADVAGRQLKARFVVENTPGAGGALGAYKVVKAQPDGYMLLLAANGELTTTQLTNPRQPYDAAKDLTPLGVLGHQAGILLSSRQAGVKSPDELVQALRKQPGKYNYATTGVGNMYHFAGEILRQRTRTDMTHVSYKAVSTLSNDLVGNTVDFGFMSPGAAKPFVDAGMVLPVAVTSASRVPLYPQVPALAEHPELKGYDVSGWFALMAPKGLPEAVSERLRATLKGVLKDPQFRQVLEGMGGQVATDAEDLPGLMQQETAHYKKWFETANLNAK